MWVCAFQVVAGRQNNNSNDCSDSRHAAKLWDEFDNCLDISHVSGGLRYMTFVNVVLYVKYIQQCILKTLLQASLSSLLKSDDCF